MNRNAAGHLLTLLTVLIWGITFVSTKILLRDFSPVEILFARFLIAYIALWLIRPGLFGLGKAERGNKPEWKLEWKLEWKHEAYFAAAGALGVTLYFLLENFALNYTLASNTSMIVSTAPMFTALLALCFLRAERPGEPI